MGCQTMSDRKRYKRDHPVATALNFGEFTAFTELLDLEVPRPDEDSQEDDEVGTLSGRLRLLITKLCRERGITVKLSRTPRLPPFPRRPDSFKTSLDERKFNREYRRVFERRQEIIDSSPEYQSRASGAIEELRLQREAQQAVVNAESDTVHYDADNEPLPTDREKIENATLSDEPHTPLPQTDLTIGPSTNLTIGPSTTECWCSDPVDPELHALHSGQEEQ